MIRDSVLVPLGAHVGNNQKPRYFFDKLKEWYSDLPVGHDWRKDLEWIATVQLDELPDERVAALEKAEAEARKQASIEKKQANEATKAAAQQAKEAEEQAKKDAEKQGDAPTGRDAALDSLGKVPKKGQNQGVGTDDTSSATKPAAAAATAATTAAAANNTKKPDAAVAKPPVVIDLTGVDVRDMVEEESKIDTKANELVNEMRQEPHGTQDRSAAKMK